MRKCDLLFYYAAECDVIYQVNSHVYIHTRARRRLSLRYIFIKIFAFIIFSFYFFGIHTSNVVNINLESPHIFLFSTSSFSLPSVYNKYFRLILTFVFRFLKPKQFSQKKIFESAKIMSISQRDG